MSASRGKAPTLAAKSFSETARAVAREVQRTGARPSAAFSRVLNFGLEE
jgi:hypothetical protein